MTFPNALNLKESLYRENHRMMKEIDVFTKVEPNRRVESLMRFRRRLQNNEQVMVLL